MSNMKFSTVKGVSQGPSTTPRLSKRELAALMTGAKVNVFIGKPGNAELLFTVWQKLATNFAVTWQRQLIEKHAGALYLPDSPKAPIKYIVEWMSAGGMQSTAKGCIPYPKDNLINLLCLNRLATYLEVDQLKKETLESIDLFTQYQRVDLKLLDQLSKTAHWTSESRPVVRTNVKKLIGGRIEQTWSAEAEEYPGRFKGALSLLGILGKEVAQEKEARRQAKVSHAKPTGVGLPGARKTPPKRRVANDKGPQNGGPNASKDANKVTTGVKDEAGSQPAPMPRVSVNATGGTMGQSSKVAKASPVCFNCGQVGHTRPYCSNPRMFLGKCHICTQQGHRAVQCPTKKAAEKEEVKKGVPKGKKSNIIHKNHNAVFAKNVKLAKEVVLRPKNGNTIGNAMKTKQTQEAVMPPLVAKIVFIKDAQKTPNKRTAIRSAPAANSPSERASSTSTSNTPRTSPETSPPPTKMVKQKGKAANAEDKPAASEDTPKMGHRFATKKVRALNIGIDGSVQREIIPGSQEEDSS